MSEVDRMAVIAHTQAEREAVMGAVAESFGACNSITADRVLDALAALTSTNRGAVEDREWLRGIVYEFLLTGPRKRTGLSDVEMQRFLSIHVGGQ